ncbi:type III-B CRISPR module-associated protein Cmr3 [Caminibacter sp.]
MNFMKITPLDTLFFRDSKPFDAGSESWSDNSLLPNPSTIWGALYSVLYNKQLVSSKKKDREKLVIKNIYLYNEEQQIVLIPAPLDIFVDKEGNFYKGEFKDVDFISNYPLKVVNYVEDKEVKILENSFIEIGSLYRYYMNGYFSNIHLYKFDDFAKRDYKIGIKIDKATNTSKEGYLYRIDLTQLIDNWSFLIEYELDGNLSFNKQGLLNLGGESKKAKYEIIDKPIALKNIEKLEDDVSEKLKNKDFIKILFTTPTFFIDGWKPQSHEPIYASVGKYVSFGGWDLEKNIPKIMKRYVPAGSVYIFKNEKDFALINEDCEPYKGFGLYKKLTI